MVLNRRCSKLRFHYTIFEVHSLTQPNGMVIEDLLDRYIYYHAQNKSIPGFLQASGHVGLHIYLPRDPVLHK